MFNYFYDDKLEFSVFDLGPDWWGHTTILYKHDFKLKAQYHLFSNKIEIIYHNYIGYTWKE